MKPLKKVEEKYIKNCVSRKFVSDENELRIKSVMTGMVGIIFQKFFFQQNPLKQSKKKNKKIAFRENLITKKWVPDQVCTMMGSVVMTP